jgi:dTDP-4-dehydrorhamnose reductase
MSKEYFIVGADGQLGTSLRALYPDATLVDRNEFDMTDPLAYENVSWDKYATIINVAAMTNVDGAETPEGRKVAWAVNASAVGLLASKAIAHDLTLVHISSDYVFDGTARTHLEDEAFAPLGVYGQTKAAGDIVTMSVPKHYILRTSWVIGEGKNFVRIMKELANKGVSPSVVNDQIGRLTFTSTLADGIVHLLDTTPEYGTYNLTNDGDSVSWAEIAQLVYEKSGREKEDVTGVSTVDYYSGKKDIAPRPLQSTMNLDKIKATGFTPKSWRDDLEEYWRKTTEEAKR